MRQLRKLKEKKKERKEPVPQNNRSFYSTKNLEARKGLRAYTNMAPPLASISSIISQHARVAQIPEESDWSRWITCPSLGQGMSCCFTNGPTKTACCREGQFPRTKMHFCFQNKHGPKLQTVP